MRIGSEGVAPKREVTLSGNVLKWHRKVKHLGNIVTSDLNDSEDIEREKSFYSNKIYTYTLS